MKVRMIRTPGRQPGDGQPERLEGQTYDLSDTEAKALIERGLAESVEPAPKPAPKPEPQPAKKP